MICILKDKGGGGREMAATWSQLNSQNFIVKNFLLSTWCTLTSNFKERNQETYKTEGKELTRWYLDLKTKELCLCKDGGGGGSSRSPFYSPSKGQPLLRRRGFEPAQEVQSGAGRRAEAPSRSVSPAGMIARPRQLSSLIIHFLPRGNQPLTLRMR